jgi:eukaryotic-like serine/threonine-protein kinase
MNDAVARLCIDQRLRWLQGEAVRVEAYLAQHPYLARQPEAILDLLYNEIVLREEAGDRPALSDYVARFPDHAAELRSQFDVHRVIEEGTIDSGCQDGPSRADKSKPQVSGYEILAEIGRGGMGVVYRARQISLNRVVALKMILAGAYAGPDEIERFRREAEAVARLQHPGIVQIFEIGSCNGRHYLALEWVDGPSLDKFAAGRPLPATEAARIVEAVARATHHVHEHGIIHRDLKPANVLLQLDECAMEPAAPACMATTIDRIRQMVPKITDFGLAKLVRDEAPYTLTRAVIGTPNYMAPEQALGRGTALGPTADVYALGAILFELLTGQPPFRGQTLYDILDRVRSNEAAFPPGHEQTVPRDLATICLKCLQKSPARRYSSALELAEDLRRFRADEPIRARPVGPVERMLKFARRRPALAGLVAVSAFAAFLLVAFDIHHRLDVDRTATDARAQELQKLEEARAAYDAFTRHRSDALFHFSYAAALASIDQAPHLTAARAAARQALAVVALNANTPAKPVLNPRWDEREQAAVGQACAQLYFVLADATAYVPSSEPGMDAAPALSRALALLDQTINVFPRTQAYYLRRARYLTQLGEAAGARQAMDQAAMVAPTSYLDWLLLGEEKFLSGEIPVASVHFRKALAFEPEDFWLLCWLAICDLKMQRPADAEANLSRCIARRPGFVWAQLLRGVARGEMDLPNAAEADFAAVLNLDSDVQGRYAVHVSRALLNLRRKRHDEAIADLEHAISLQPKLVHARMTLAQVFQDAGKLAESNAEYARTLELKPPASIAAECHVQRSWNFYVSAKHVDSVKEASKALEFAEGNCQAHLCKAMALLELKEYAEVLKCLDQFKAGGGVHTASFFRTRTRARMQLGDFIGAADDATRALDLAPDAELWAYRGWAYFFTDAARLALRDFDEALRLDDGLTDAYVGRGLAKVMLGQSADAIADADEGLRRKPRTAEMMHNVACIFALAAGLAEKLDDSEAATKARVLANRAVKIVQQALEMVPSPQRAAFWREKVYPDSALAAIRSHESFKELEKSYSQAGAGGN